MSRSFSVWLDDERRLADAYRTAQKDERGGKTSDEVGLRTESRPLPTTTGCRKRTRPVAYPLLCRGQQRAAMGFKVARSRLQILDIAGIEERPLACDAAGPTGFRQMVAAGLVLQVTIADQGLQCAFPECREV